MVTSSGTTAAGLTGQGTQHTTQNFLKRADAILERLDQENLGLNDTVQLSDKAVKALDKGVGFLRNEFEAVVSYVEFTKAKETISLNIDENGIEITKTLEQTRIVASQLSIEQSQTLGILNGLGSERADEELADFLKAFQDVLEDFRGLLDRVFGPIPPGGLIA